MDDLDADTEVDDLADYSGEGVDGHLEGEVSIGDFMVDARNEPFFLEINTLPGFTTISMYAKMWEASGVPYPALLDRLIDLAKERHAEKQRLRTSVM